MASCARLSAALVVAYGSDVLSTCVAMVRDRAAAEDVTQEVFGDAVRALATFRGESSPRTWLLSIARNRCIDYLRARKRDPWAGAGGALDERDTDPDAHPDTQAEGGDWLVDRSLVMRGLDALAEGDRALIVLRFRNGLEYGELATAFGLREGTVRMRVSRALGRMREVLEGEVAAPVAPAAPAQSAPARAMPAAPATPAAAARARAGAPPPPPAPGAVGGAAFGAPPLARAPVSWWARLRAWAGLREGPDQDAEPVAAEPRRSDPVGTLGLALAAMGTPQPSDALAVRLAALIGVLEGGSAA